MITPILAEWSERRTVPLRLPWCMIPSMDQTNPPRDPKDVADNKDLAALSYVWILSVVVLFAKRGSPFVQFHARQGAVLFALSLVVWAMPFIGKLAEVLILALCIMGFLHAAQGEWRDVPVIGPLSRGSFHDVRASWKDVVAAVTSLWARVRSSAKASDPTSSAAGTAASPENFPPEAPEQPAVMPVEAVPPPENEVPPPAQP